MFCACVYNAKRGSPCKKERKEKKRRRDLLGFNTLNVFLLVSLFKTSRKRERKRTKKKRKKKKTKKDDERKPLGVHALPNLTPALEILAIVRVSFNKKQEKRRRTCKR